MWHGRDKSGEFMNQIFIHDEPQMFILTTYAKIVLQEYFSKESFWFHQYYVE